MRTTQAMTLSLLAVLGCTDADDPPDTPPSDTVQDPVPSNPPGSSATLTDQEITGLLFMREEEKLARDVYDALDGYGQVFVNIQGSEQRHFDAMGTLLVTYGLTDPAAGNGPGVFTDTVLQDLYAELVNRGTPNRLDALGVGCAIEELDIRDIALARDATSRPDIQTTYDNLLLGSRNHLRAFYGQLVAAGGSYTPIYIDQATFDAIVSSPKEQGGG